MLVLGDIYSKTGVTEYSAKWGDIRVDFTMYRAVFRRKRQYNNLLLIIILTKKVTGFTALNLCKVKTISTSQKLDAQIELLF